MIKITIKKLIYGFLVIVFLFTSIQSGYAFSTLSIQPAGFSSNDDYLDGDAWLLTISDDGNSQYAQGTIGSEDIKDSSGAHAEHDLTIKTEVTEQSCDYQLKQNYDPNIYTYNLELIGHDVFIWEVNEYYTQCQNKDNYYWTFYSYYGLWGHDVYCMTRNKIGVPGTIKTPALNFKSDISITANGDTETGTISSMGAKSVRLNNIGYAHWAGSLSSGEFCPDMAAGGYNIIHNEDGNWVLNKDHLYNSYRSYKQNSYDSAENQIVDEFLDGLPPSSNDISAFESTISKLNGYAKDATNEFGYKDFKISSSSLSNGQAHLELDRIIQFPVITMHVKASWLGIVALVGEPSIVSLSTNKFEEGKTGYITVKIKNKADVTASFGLSADCYDPFEQIGSDITVSNLGAGKTTTKTIPITVTTNKEISKYCNIIAYDLNNPDQFHMKSVKVTASPIRLCAPGDERCDGEIHKVCNGDGSAWVKTTSDKCQVPACSKDSDCNDDDACTDDTCEDGKCNFEYHISDTCPGDELCQYKSNGEEFQEYTTAKNCCELQNGRWDPGEKASWWGKLWGKEDKPAKCYLGHLSIIAMILMVVGIVLFMIFKIPHVLLLTLLGAIIQVLASAGII